MPESYHLIAKQWAHFSDIAQANSGHMQKQPNSLLTSCFGFQPNWRDRSVTMRERGIGAGECAWEDFPCPNYPRPSHCVMPVLDTGIHADAAMRQGRWRKSLGAQKSNRRWSRPDMGPHRRSAGWATRRSEEPLWGRTLPLLSSCVSGRAVRLVGGERSMLREHNRSPHERAPLPLRRQGFGLRRNRGVSPCGDTPAGAPYPTMGGTESPPGMAVAATMSHRGHP